MDFFLFPRYNTGKMQERIALPPGRPAGPPDAQAF